MKKIISVLISLAAFFLIACSGSDTYLGKWKATNANGDKFDLEFSAKKFSVKDSSGQIKKYEYKQHSIHIDNSIKTYGIKLEDGRAYDIHFPKENDDNIALIRDEQGQPLYTLSRKDYIKYESVYKLE
ncbi:hypothetical protein CNR22_15130 [Sphingobacteriaceae bacterium]|nr:hypothetical protein CNR22_15130 [Sphingobacteriaceae bacterium]